MDSSIQIQKLLQIEKRKWLLVVGLVAITHVFCQSLMLPYGKALVSLLPESETAMREKVRISSLQPSVRVEDEPSIETALSLVDASVLVRGVKGASNSMVGEEALEDNTPNAENNIKGNNSISDGKSLDDGVDFPEDGDNDMPFEETVDVEQGFPTGYVNQSLGVSEKSIEAGNALSLELVVTSSNQDLSDGKLKKDDIETQGGANSSNGSAVVRKPVKKKMKSEMPPKKVTLINEMERLLVRHRARSRAMKPRWSSKHDEEIFAAKLQIENAPLIQTDQDLYAPLYRNISMFKRSYELMERLLKIYVYKDGEKPIFHQPVLKGLYASEGWFMKLMEGNKQFTVKDPRRAHLFYMPFSTRMLEHTLYVRNSHNRTNLRQYLKEYSEKIAAKYRFWNRTGGADHFLVACHDWAPYETRHHMEQCIKALCNADVTIGFKIGRDVSLPETYVRSARNPLRDLGGKPPSQRHILAFYAGSLHGYLRPILLKYWKDKDPDMKIFGPMPPGVASKMNYIQHMKSSKYCICPKGYEVNSPRVVEAIFYECVPVIISDNFVPPFFEILNWNAFSIILAEKDIPNVKDILTSVSEERYREMQLGVKKVQRHFLWHAKPLKYDLFHMTLHSIWYNRVFQVKLR